MTWLARLMTLFPTLHLGTLLGAIAWFVFYPCWLTLACIPASAYLLPLCAYHLHQRIWRLEEGTFSIVDGYSPWFGTHMIQQGLIAVPFLENVLRLVPGLFQWWLRAWGARIGRNVYFAPGFEIADRGMLDVGDHCIFGYGVKVTSHYISPSRRYGGMKIYIKRVRFEDRAFLGASSRFGPGVIVKTGAMVRATVDVLPDIVVEARSDDSTSSGDVSDQAS